MAAADADPMADVDHAPAADRAADIDDVSSDDDMTGGDHSAESDGAEDTPRVVHAASDTDEPVAPTPDPAVLSSEADGAGEDDGAAEAHAPIAAIAANDTDNAEPVDAADSAEDAESDSTPMFVAEPDEGGIHAGDAPAEADGAPDSADPASPPPTLVEDAPSEEPLFQFTESDVGSEEDALAMGGAEEEGADDVLDLSTPGSTVVLPRDANFPVEEVAVRPPSGPDPDGRDKLMLVEDGESEDSAAAGSTPPAPTEPAAEPEPARPAPPPVRRPPVFNDPVYALMVETMDRIRTVYSGDTMPDPVHRIQALVDSQDYDRIRNEFSVMIDDLTEYHRQAGSQIQPKAAHHFRIIETLVRNL
jgi:hypothetical protein